MVLLVLLLQSGGAEHPFLALQAGICWQNGKYHPQIFPARSQSGPRTESQESFSLPAGVSPSC